MTAPEELFGGCDYSVGAGREKARKPVAA